jgi:phosphatidylserine/phosphatidylglycerophosphate/cardiolipin synthase-like enzyme
MACTWTRAAIVALLISVGAPSASWAADLGRVADVCFVPGDRDCEAVITGEIDQATREVLVQAYSFTSDAIVRSLVAAKRRGVDVRVILDAKATSEERKEQIAAQTLVNSGVVVLIDGNFAIAHSKVVIIDGRRVETGSYNYTASARRRNSENLVVLEGSEIAGQYRAIWIARAQNSVSFSP